MKHDAMRIGIGNPTESSHLNRDDLAKAWKDNCRLFSGAGVHLFFPHVELVDCWLDDETYNFSAIDTIVRMTMEIDPEARFILRLRSKAPDWWHEKHPEQAIRYHDGSDRVPQHHWEPGTRPASLASDKWQSDLELLYRKAVIHVQDSEYADRVIGYNPAGMHGGEWFEEGSMYDLRADYSPLMQKAFTKYLEAKYPGQDVHDVRIPDPEERLRGDIGSFRDPVKSRYVIDYYLLAQDLIASLAEGCCRAIKEATNGTALVGIYYGYTVELSAVMAHPGWLQDSGHLALRKIVNSPHIDYLSSMLEYVYRAPGGFCWSFGPIADSCRVHGKFYIGEDEIRTWLNRSDPSIFSYIEELPNAKEAVQVIRRNFACMQSHSSWQEFVDLSGGWYDDPAILDEISQLNALANAPNIDHTPVAQIAVCVDETSFIYQGIADAGNINRALILDSLLPLFHVGAPIDLYLLSDLTDGYVPLDQYRFIVLLNAFFMSDAQRRFFTDSVFCGGRTVLSYYAPGFLSPERASVDGIRDFTGFNVCLDSGRAVTRVKAKGREYGTDAEISPVFFVDDESTEVLGRLTSSGMPGLCRKRFDDWTSIYSAAPAMPSELLRRFAQEAGAHIYVESNDLIHATKNMVAIHAGEPGDKRVMLPGPMDIHDSSPGGAHLKGTREIKAHMGKGETRIWLIES